VSSEQTHMEKIDVQRVRKHVILDVENIELNITFVYSSMV
jgi:hypothetical protein